MNYLILSGLVIGTACLYEYVKSKQEMKKSMELFFYVSICLILCIFAGLRTRYNDTPAYMQTFESTPQKFSSLFSNEFSISEVYLFKIWNYLIYHGVSKNPQVFLFCSSAFFVFPAIYLIKKYSRDYIFSIILFMFGGMFLFSLAGLKQVMATGVILMGIPALIRKQYIRYYIYCVLALGFHTYSLFFLVVPLLGREVFNKRTIIFCVTIVLAGVLISYVSSVIKILIEMLGKEMSEEKIQSGSVNVLRAIVFLVPLVLTIMGAKNLESTTEAEQIFIKFTMLSAVFMVLALFGNPILFGRIPQYFLIGTVITLPVLIEKAFEHKERSLIAFCAILGYVLFGMYQLYIDGAFTQDIFQLIIF